MEIIMYIVRCGTGSLRPKRVRGFWSARASPQTCTSAFLMFCCFSFAVKRCPIAAKIAGILLCCVLNDLFT